MSDRPVIDCAVGNSLSFGKKYFVSWNTKILGFYTDAMPHMVLLCVNGS